MPTHTPTAAAMQRLTSHRSPVHEQPGDHWVCSDKQKELILSLVEQHGLDKKEVEAIAKEMFGLPVKTLNRLQASGLIEELLERHGKGNNGNGNGQSQRRLSALPDDTHAHEHARGHPPAAAHRRPDHRSSSNRRSVRPSWRSSSRAG